ILLIAPSCPAIATSRNAAGCAVKKLPASLIGTARRYFVRISSDGTLGSCRGTSNHFGARMVELPHHPLGAWLRNLTTKWSGMTGTRAPSGIVHSLGAPQTVS